MLKKFMALVLCLPLISYADNSIGTVVAATVASQVVNAGSAVYMKNNGIQPQYISTPYGIYVVPQQNSASMSHNPTPAQPAAPQPSQYEVQNQQQSKVQFFNAAVVQSFPNTPGNMGAN